jgi:hypothetical protein
MLSYETIIIIVIIVAVSYYMYTMLLKQNSSIRKNEDNIVNNVIESFNSSNEELIDKLDLMEEKLHIKIKECEQKINDIDEYNKNFSKINKMNNQAIISQMNLYNEEDIEHDGNNILYSIDPNKECFIKKEQNNQEEQEMFYMSSNNKNNESLDNINDTSSQISNTTNSTKNSRKSNNTNKSNISKELD